MGIGLNQLGLGLTGDNMKTTINRGARKEEEKIHLQNKER
jgi:hypothetical protein